MRDNLNAAARWRLRRKERRTILALVLVNALVWSAVAIHGRLVVNWTDSNPYALFWLTPYDGGKLHRGDWVVFTTAYPLVFGGKPFTAIKEAGCLSGESLSLTRLPADNGSLSGRAYYCGGRLLGVAKTTALDGRKLTAASLPAGGVVPADSFWAEGHRYSEGAGGLRDDSLDSRYFGPVGMSALKGTAVPLF